MLRWCLLALAALPFVSLLACGDDDGDGASPSASPTSPSVATVTDTPDPGEEAIQSAPEPGSYRLTPVVPAADFDNMLGFEMLPGSEDEALVLTQHGEIWRVPLGDGEAERVADLSERIIQDPGFEEGLLGIAFSPDFATDNTLYLYFSAGEPRRTVLSRFHIAPDGTLDLGSEEVLLEVAQPYANHNGGQLAFGPDGYLYVALGDGGSAGDPHETGQDPTDLLGSILRLDVSGPGGYVIPADNPFADRPPLRPEVYAYGLRNPWRFSFDAETGDLWVADVGQAEWEEVNRVEAGGNYGWDVMEGFDCFEPEEGCDTEGLIPPIAVYGHEGGNCSITGGHVYHGGAMPELEDWYVYADFCSGDVWALDTQGEEPVPVLIVQSGLPIASWGRLPNGELVAVTFANQIALLTPATG